MSGKTRRQVLLVDDHPLTCKGLMDAIAAEPDLEVCGAAAGWREALELIGQRRPDIVVLDLNLQDGNGWDLMKQLELDPASPPVLILSVCDEEVYALRLLRAGSKGYLMKDAPISRVLEAVRKVLGGHIAVSDTMASSLIQVAAHGSGPRPEENEISGLSDRELQVFEFLRQGLGNSAIAERLGLSQKTVGTYKARLMEKLGVRTTPELVARVRGASPEAGQSGEA
jgi:DNA-binding NarL/FixJ family response regulator